MSEYKLYYFNGRGRGEVARILFALGGAKYEDVRYEDDQWKSAREKLNPPFGQLPVLSIDGQLFGQSLSINRYLAEKFGFAGKTELDKLRADMVAHCCEDYAEAIFRAHFDEDAAKRATLTKKLKDGDLKTYFSNFEKILKQNKGGDGYFVGDSITYADITFVHFAEFVTLIGENEDALLAEFPKLKGLKEKVNKNPKVAEWIAKRPQTPW